MQRASQGQTVQVEFTGKLKDGTVVAANREGAPFEFTIGHGHVMPAFEEVVVGMAPGEQRTAEIGAKDAYGVRRPDRVMAVSRQQFPPTQELHEGTEVALREPEGGRVQGTVQQVRENEVVLDTNHPLAGKDIVFDIRLVSVK